MTSMTIKTHKTAEAGTKISHSLLFALAPPVSCMACIPPGFVVAADETSAVVLFTTGAHLIVTS